MESESAPPPQRPVGCHRLPQIPTMGRNVRTAQSKSSARLSFESKLSSAENVLQPEDTSKDVKIWSNDNAAVSNPVVPFDNNVVTDQDDNSKSKGKDFNGISHMDTQVNDSGDEIKMTVKLESCTDIDNRENVQQPRKRGQKSKDVSVAIPKKGKVSNARGNQLKPKEKTKNKTVQLSSNSKMKLPHDLVKRIESPVKKNNNDLKVDNINNQSLSQAPRSLKCNRVETQTSAEIGVNTEITDSQVASTVHLPRCVIITPKELPSEAQKEKMLEQLSVAFELQCPVVWKEGDLKWGKVSGHPYWPCMISPCPFTNVLTRGKSLNYQCRLYHVQFFGNDCERGWLTESSLMEFKGKEDFLNVAKLNSLKPKVVKRGKSNYNPFKVKPTREAEWNIAVEEAENTFALSVDERISQYTFDYVFSNSDNVKKTSPPIPSVQGKRKRKESITWSPNESKRKKRKIGHNVEPVLVDLSVDKEVNPFDVYYAKHRNEVMAMHPDWDTSAVFEHLKAKWSALSPSKANSPDNPPASGKRTKKPTMKLVESIVQARIHNESADFNSEVSPKKRGRPKKQLISPEKPLPPAVASVIPQESDISSEASSPNPVSKVRRSRKSVSSVMSPKVDTAVEEVLPVNTAVVAAVLSSRKSSQDSDSSSESKSKRARDNEPYELEIYKLQSTSKIEKDHICTVCGQNEDLIECHGSCGQHFHRKCLPSPTKICDYDFKCEECISGIHPCFSCKAADASTRKCNVTQCGKYYHESCVKQLRLTRVVGENKGFICPLHTCQTCAVDNIKNIKATKGGRLFRCIRCPTAYHSGDFCVAAGSKVLGGGFIECSDHFLPNKSLASHAHVNITWCFLCSKGGALICCESCPASYHAECVNVEKMPDEAWFCEECKAGRRPLYGNIVWIKVGNYRWWPGEICHPRHVPLNIQEKSHQLGEFPVRFFGSHDYYWIHRGRVFLFEEGDKASREGSSKNLYKVYMRGVLEATDAFNQWKAAKEKKEEQEQEKSDKKPSIFKFAKRNYPIGNVQINVADVSEIPRCECKEDQEDPCGSDCLNRMVMYECHPAVCPAKERCNNQRFQKRQYAECEPAKSEGRGWGLKTLQNLKKGQFVMEYVGDLIDEEECKKRIKLAHENNISNFYMLTMDKNKIIDAGPRGNNSRFMNHCCCPNMETQKWMVNGDIRVGLFSLCDIPTGTELTFNYNLECLGNEKTACACGAENCSGFLGVRPKTAAAIANEKKVKELKKKKKKKKIDPKKEHEDDCFRCGEGGELVMCDRWNCPKVYHLQCLKLSKPPTGKWSCPWHHCDTCGKAATSLCTECPNSFCLTHTDGNIIKIAECLYCDEHEDFIDELSKSMNVDASMETPDTAMHKNEILMDVADVNPIVEKSLMVENEEEMVESEKFVLSDKKEANEKKGEKAVASGKKVARRKSFKDILKDGSSVHKGNKLSPSRPHHLSKNKNSKVNDMTESPSEPTGVKGYKKHKLPNGVHALDENVTVDGMGNNDKEGQNEKNLKKKASVGRRGKAGKLCRTNCSGTDGVVGSSVPTHLAGRGQEDSEDNDSISDLVIDIP